MPARFTACSTCNAPVSDFPEEAEKLFGRKYKRLVEIEGRPYDPACAALLTFAKRGGAAQAAGYASTIEAARERFAEWLVAQGDDYVLPESCWQLPSECPLWHSGLSMAQAQSILSAAHRP